MEKGKRVVEVREGPPQYFLPVCIRYPWGFQGGPSGYKRVGEEHRDHGPIIVEPDHDQRRID